MTEVCNYYSISVTAPILTRCHNRASSGIVVRAHFVHVRTYVLRRTASLYAQPFPVAGERVAWWQTGGKEGVAETRCRGSQLKRISAPATHSRRQFSSRRSTLTFLAPFPLRRAKSVSNSVSESFPLPLSSLTDIVALSISFASSTLFQHRRLVTKIVTLSHSCNEIFPSFPSAILSIFQYRSSRVGFFTKQRVENLHRNGDYETRRFNQREEERAIVIPLTS